MTARHVQLTVAFRLFKPFSDAVFLNVRSGACMGEADVLVVRRSMWATEIEVKVSVSDFKADFKKGEGEWTGFSGKHDRLVQGHPRYVSRLAEPDNPVFADADDLTFGIHDLTDREPHRCRQFFFAVPEPLVASVLPILPEHAGLISVDGKQAGYVKQAPKLKPSRKYTESEVAALYKTCYYKVWKQNADRFRALT